MIPAQITAWKTSDNKLFQHECEANRHESILSFDTWYKAHSFSERIDPAKLAEWICDNASDFQYYLDKFEKV